jgi:hypothetical protein
VFITHDLRRAVQVTRAGVVAQPRPQVQHFIGGGISQRAHLRKPRHESFEIRNDSDHLGLLQHDFRHPHAVGCAIELPGQIVSPGAGVPGE